MDYEFSVALVGKALDGLHLRAIATAQNIANANSVDYVPQQVSFEEQLASAATTGLDAVRLHEAEILSRPYGPEGDAMRLDLEMATASETALRYSALVEILGQRMEIERMSIRGAQ